MEKLEKGSAEGWGGVEGADVYSGKEKTKKQYVATLKNWNGINKDDDTRLLFSIMPDNKRQQPKKTGAGEIEIKH